MTTVEEFLRPLKGPEELDHILVKVPDNALQKTDPASVSEEVGERHDSTTSRFAPLAENIQDWPEFDVEEISSDPLISTCLSRPCQVAWVPWTPSFARVIYNERQLEVLYLQTLITRVNIALDKAIPPEEDRVAIVIGPGAFESVSAEATGLRLMPDWVVVQGTFDTNMDGRSPPTLQTLAENDILAVGDTKLVRRWPGDGNVLHTKACHKVYLRQIQNYCSNLYTRYGFILSNKELVVTQFEGAQDAAPRGVDQRSLRSNGAQQPNLGLNDDGSQGSASSQPPNAFDDPYELPPLIVSPAQVPLKRPHPSTSPETSPVAAAAASGRSRYAIRSSSGTDRSSIGSPRPPTELLASEASSSQDHSNYTSSVRDVEVGAAYVRSFDMTGWEEEDNESPYKALFMFVMMIRARKLGGQPLYIC